jgi:hypothetical protein
VTHDPGQKEEEPIMKQVSRITGQVLSSLGMGRATTDWFPKVFIGFSVGLLSGAAAALMLSPKTGEQVRGDLRVGAQRLVKKGKAQLAELKEKVSQRAGHQVHELESERHPLGV